MTSIGCGLIYHASFTWIRIYSIHPILSFRLSHSLHPMRVYQCKPGVNLYGLHSLMNISFIMRPSVTWSWAGVLSCSVIVHPCMALYTWVEKVKTDRIRYNAKPNERAADWRPRCIIFQGTRGYSGATGHRVQSLYTCQANLWQIFSRLVSSGKRVSMGLCVCVWGRHHCVAVWDSRARWLTYLVQQLPAG